MKGFGEDWTNLRPMDTQGHHPVTTLATLLLARNKSLPAGRGSSPEGGQERKRPSGNTQGRTGKKPRKKHTGEDHSRWDPNLKAYTHNRKGIEICQKYNRGQCGDGRPQGKCDNKRSHQCSSCLGPHMAKDCKGTKEKD